MKDDIKIIKNLLDENERHPLTLSPPDIFFVSNWNMKEDDN